VKILTVVGARPQFVKASVVSRALRAQHQEVLLHTGQHYDDELSAQFFRELQLPAPDVELNVGSALHGEQTARMLIGIERAIVDRGVDRVLVYGDTNSTVAGALAAAKLQVPVAHVEAGLRSFNRRMPEELNRVVTDQLSDLLFCPSQTAVDNLAREGLTSGVHVVGDVMAEAVRMFAPSRELSTVMCARHGLTAGQYGVATVHRAENTDAVDRLQSIVDGFGRLNFTVAFPVHPRTRAALERAGSCLPPNVRLLPPVGYVEMLALVSLARVVLTDSGGLQKEAYWLGVPCVTLRDETEWVETIAAGWNHLVGADADRLVETVERMTIPMARPPLYGEGNAVDRICAVLSGVASEPVRV
jgi:UDP-N-acetylglucosamine 2-epimerase